MLSLAIRFIGINPCRSIDGISYSMVPELQLSKVRMMVSLEPGGLVRFMIEIASKIPL
jgi:hypothetical protein